MYAKTITRRVRNGREGEDGYLILPSRISSFCQSLGAYKKLTGKEKGERQLIEGKNYTLRKVTAKPPTFYIFILYCKLFMRIKYSISEDNISRADQSMPFCS